MKIKGETRVTIASAADLLRRYEPCCYQIAFFLLQQEELAIRVAAQVLLAIARTPAFFKAGEAEQRLFIKRNVIKESLKQKAAV